MKKATLGWFRKRKRLYFLRRGASSRIIQERKKGTIFFLRRKEWWQKNLKGEKDVALVSPLLSADCKKDWLEVEARRERKPNLFTNGAWERSWTSKGHKPGEINMDGGKLGGGGNWIRVNIRVGKTNWREDFWIIISRFLNVWIIISRFLNEISWFLDWVERS